MRILHTADWHIGQTLNGWSRDHEHRAFLDRFHDVILEALLHKSGDRRAFPFPGQTYPTA